MTTLRDIHLLVVNEMNNHTEKFYRTVVTIEVLSDRPLVDKDGYNYSLAEIAHEIEHGDFSGKHELFEEVVSKEQMAELLLDQGSDPEFLLGELDDEI